MTPLCLINVVGLTPRLVGRNTPRLAELAARHGARPLAGVLPAVTCTAQATMLTGAPPSVHGIVGNGWLYPDTREVRFWQQSRRLMRAGALYDAARALAGERGEPFACANLFWWFNQGAAAEWSLTPKPWYGCDGDKAFGIHGCPPGFPQACEESLGAFPFHAFWGPTAGLASSDWIARAAALTLRRHRPALTLVYLPHLDYDLQRFGPSGADLPRLLGEVDACVGRVADAARNAGAAVVVVSEYGLSDVRRPVYINRILREQEVLTVRDGPFGETIDPFQSAAFAVADHQVAHVYLRDAGDREQVRARLRAEAGIDDVLAGDEIRAHGLDHARSGDLVAVADPDAWFAYPYWLDADRAPDFARTVDIHRKPGYDPCELFFDPGLFAPKARAGWRLLQKKLGFRTRFDVVPLDARLVRGSHGRLPEDPMDGAVLIASSEVPPPESPRMTDVRDYALRAMGLA